MHRLAFLGLLTFLLHGTAGCGGDAFSAAAGDGGTPRDGASGGDGSSSGGDSASGGDAPQEGCVSMPENCTNGIDDDCNGLTDCADPACNAGYLCVPGPDMGWTLQSYERSGRTTCPAGYGPADDVFESGGPASCGCSCSGGQVSCDWAGVDMYYGTGTCPTTANQTVSPTSCQPLGVPIAPGDFIKVDPLTPHLASCNSMPNTNVPPETQGRLCPAMSVGAGCSGTDVCAPRVGLRAICVVHPGMAACPSHFSVRHDVATSYDDTRGCSQCSCTASVGAVGCDESLELFTSALCTGAPGDKITANSTCGSVGSSGPFTSVQWSATPFGGGCAQATSVMPTGTETPQGPSTVCCL